MLFSYRSTCYFFLYENKFYLRNMFFLNLFNLECFKSAAKIGITDMHGNLKVKFYASYTV